MAWSTPSSRTTGTLITAAIWNQDVVDNPVALRAGGIAIASQAALDLAVASSATQWGRLAKGTGEQALQMNAAATAVEWASRAIIRAWAYVTFSGGTPSLVAGFNAASVTDNGDGLTTVNFTSAITANYAAVATGINSGGDPPITSINAPQTTSVQVRTKADTGALTDYNFSLIVVGP